MKRLDRQFAILVALQARRRVTARDLAQRLEVTERTIYRDVAALSETGVPIVSLPGFGYELSPGFFLPPLVFTPDEASALSLGARLLAARAIGRLPQDATRALEKVSAVLPAAARSEVDRLSSVISFMTRGRPFDLDDPRLRLLQDAIGDRSVLRLRYHAYGSGDVTERDVEPLQLRYAGGWYLSAYCRRRAGLRDFRLERIDHLDVLSERFTPRAELDGAAPLRGNRAANLTADPLTTVRIRVFSDSVRWVREWQHQGLVEEEPPAPDGSVVMRYAVEAPLEMRPWLFSWGAAAIVLEPASLRAAQRAEAERLLDLSAMLSP